MCGDSGFTKKVERDTCFAGPSKLSYSGRVARELPVIRATRLVHKAGLPEPPGKFPGWVNRILRRMGSFRGSGRAAAFSTRHVSGACGMSGHGWVLLVMLP